MRSIRLLVAVTLGVGVLVMSGAGPALACSCAMASVQDNVKYADVIVTGTLTGMEDPPQKPVMSSGDPITYFVDVDAMFKGEAGSEVEFTSAMSGASCGLEGMQVDRRYTFFLNHAGDGLDAGLCGGTALTTDALNTEVAQWTGPPDAPQVAAPAGAPTHAATDEDPPAQPAWPVWMVGLGAGLLVAATAGALFWSRRSR